MKGWSVKKGFDDRVMNSFLTNKERYTDLEHHPASAPHAPVHLIHKQEK